MLSVRLLVNRRLLVVTSGENQKLHAEFLLHRGLAHLPHCLRVNCIGKNKETLPLAVLNHILLILEGGENLRKFISYNEEYLQISNYFFFFQRFLHLSNSIKQTYFKTFKIIVEFHYFLSV